MAEEAEELKTEEVKVHEITMSMVKSAPAEVGAGTDIALKIRVSCSLACDLRGQIAKIIDQGAVVANEIELTEFDETVNETDEFVVRSPIEPGEYTWTAVFPPQDKEGVLHEESSTPFSFIVKPHATSMAVWDVASPTVLDTSFKLKAGVKCSVECNLTGKEIEIYDHEGAKVATGTLGGAPYSDTVNLYWTEVELKAPSIEGRYTWTVKFPKPDLELAHEGAAYTFGFLTARPPECEVTVEVIDKDTDTPIENAQVIMRPNLYRGYTDERGVAKIGVAKGEYKLYVSAKERAPKGIKHECRGVPLITSGREYKLYVPETNKDNMEPFQMTIKVDSDIAIKVELVGIIEPLEEDTL